MQKSSSILSLPFSFVLIFTLVSDIFSQKKSKTPDTKRVSTETIKDEYIGLEDVILEKERLAICPFYPYQEGSSCDGDKQSIKVASVAKTAEKHNLTFHYFVTGGKIIGEGTNVIWDFKEEKPGTYSLTVVTTKDLIVKGKTITKSFKYLDCGDCDPPCACPSKLTISSPKTMILVGDSLILQAEISGGKNSNIGYKWTVSSGKIEMGQGTKQILVKIDESIKLKIITATVEIQALCTDCPNSASTTIEIKDK